MASQYSVEPLNDGSNIAPRLLNVGDNAEEFLYLTIWGLDVWMGWSAVGASSPPHISPVMRAAAERIGAAARKKAPPATVNDAYARVLYLVWDMTLDNVYEPANSDLDDISSVHPNWGPFTNAKPSDLPATINSGESIACLEELRNYLVNSKSFTQYRKSTSGRTKTTKKGKRRAFRLLLPSGVTGYVQKNLDYRAGSAVSPIYLSSHHQKYVVSEKEAYVGGFNFLKEYWDTPDHDFVNTARDSSEGPNPQSKIRAFLQTISGPAELLGPQWNIGLSTLSSLVGAAQPIEGNESGCLHDTGTFIAGDVLLRSVTDAFLQRWKQSEQAFKAAYAQDPAVVDESPYSAYLRDIKRQGYPPTVRHEIAKIVNKHAMKRAGKIVQTATSNVADPNFLIPAASIAQTLAFNQSTAIFDGYVSRLRSLKEEDAFFYAESQYFTQVDIAHEILDAYYLNGRDPHFCYIVIPYTPATHWADIAGFVVQRSIVEAEFKLLKWLEIRSARTVYFRDGNGEWVPKFLISPQEQDRANPQLRRIHFKDTKVNDDPRFVNLDSEIVICDPIFLDASGNRIRKDCPPLHSKVDWTVARDQIDCGQPENVPGQIITCTVGDIMTDSDIMTFALVSHNVPARGSQSPIRNIMRRGHIYVHSKSAVFVTGINQLVDFATTGSANLNDRSLVDAAAHTDTEMNVFWEHEYDVNNWRATLWAEHMESGLPTKYTHRAPASEKNSWAKMAWDNFQALRATKLSQTSSTTGHIVRLDVVDRYRDLVRKDPEPLTSTWNPPLNK